MPTTPITERLAQALETAFNTLQYYANLCTYEAERTGGMLAGCPRGPKPTPEQLVTEARLALRTFEPAARAWLAAYRQPTPSAEPQCAGDPGECAFNKACMYRCGRMEPPIAEPPAECGNTPYDEGPFTLAEPIAEPAAAERMHPHSLHFLVEAAGGTAVTGGGAAFTSVALAKFVVEVIAWHATPQPEPAAAPVVAQGLMAALTELVALKDLKDKWTDPIDGSWLRNRMRDEYCRRQPAAWDAARTALATHPAPEQREPLTRERILHLWDTHVGLPTAGWPFNDGDKEHFARAIEAEIRAAGAQDHRAGSHAAQQDGQEGVSSTPAEKQEGGGV